MMYGYGHLSRAFGFVSPIGLSPPPSVGLAVTEIPPSLALGVIDSRVCCRDRYYDHESFSIWWLILAGGGGGVEKIREWIVYQKKKVEKTSNSKKGQEDFLSMGKSIYVDNHLHAGRTCAVLYLVIP